MYLIRIGRRVLSLEHLVAVEYEDPSDPTTPPPGTGRATLERGLTFEIRGDDLALLNRHLEQVLTPDPTSSAGTPGRVAVAIDPKTGQPIHRDHEGSEGG